MQIEPYFEPLGQDCLLMKGKWIQHSENPENEVQSVHFQHLNHGTLAIHQAIGRRMLNIKKGGAVPPKSNLR